MDLQKTYRDYWRCRIIEQQAQQQQAVQQARRELRRIVELLVQKFGVDRIIVFGSLVRGGFTPESDIDLAVAGLPVDAYFTAMAAVNHLTDRWVDLKPLEDLHPHFRQRVFQTGEEIYARDLCE